jgi:hypothetical protein
MHLNSKRVDSLLSGIGSRTRVNLLRIERFLSSGTLLRELTFGWLLSSSPLSIPAHRVP